MHTRNSSTYLYASDKSIYLFIEKTTRSFGVNST